MKLLHLHRCLVLVSFQMNLKLLLHLHLSSAVPMNLPLFLSFEHSWSLLFFFSQICSFTLHLKFLTIVTHLIYRILILLGTIVYNKILFQFEDNEKQTLFKTNKLCLNKTIVSFSNRSY